MRHIKHTERAANITHAEQARYADYCAQAYAGFGSAPVTPLSIHTYVIRLREAQAR